MMFENPASFRKTEQLRGARALFLEDPFERAVEEASMKLLHSVCTIFQRGTTSASYSNHTAKLHGGSEDSFSDMLRRQHSLQSGTYGVSHQFAAASFTFAPTSNCQREGNAKECSLRAVDGGCKNLASTHHRCLSEGVREEEQSQGSREQPLIGECLDLNVSSHMEETDNAGDKMQKEMTGPSKQSAMASLTPVPTDKYRHEEDVHHQINHPTGRQLLSHPLALLSYIPKDLSLFFAGAVAGATAKTVTAPLDRIKLLMQVHGVRATQEIKKESIGFLEAAVKIGKEEGIQGYWKGNLPQVIRVIPYSAVQLLSYELYKKLFKGNEKELSVAGRLAAGACAGMTSTLVTYPLDVLRLRLAVDSSCRSMVQVATTILREEGLSSFYRGLGPSLLGIAPYIALNFCAFDLIKKSLPEDTKKTPAASFLTAFLSASLATTMCYPLDTVRRQLQMKGTPYITVLDAIPGIVAKDGVLGLYRGFVPNALKNLPNSSIRLTTFDSAKNLINASQQEFQRLINMRRGVSGMVVDLPSTKRS